MGKPVPASAERPSAYLLITAVQSPMITVNVNASERPEVDPPADAEGTATTRLITSASKMHIRSDGILEFVRSR